MVLDAYLFGRDLIPQIMETEQAIINAIPGLAPLEKTASNIVSKLPDLGALTKMITGEAKKEKEVVKEGNESLQPINIGDGNNLDTSTLETNASYESSGGEVALVNSSSDGGGTDTSEEGGDVVNMSNNGDDDNRDTSSDLFYKNSG